MQVVLLFQFACRLLALVEVVAGTDSLAVLLNSDGNDVHVVTVDVLMLIDHVGLSAKTNLLHILTGDIFHIRVRQFVVRMWIEGDMYHRILRAASVGDEVHEVLHCLADIHLARTIIEDAVGGKQLALILVNLLAVVGQCPEERVTETYLCDHLSLYSFVSSKIFVAISTNCCMYFSSL